MESITKQIHIFPPGKIPVTLQIDINRSIESVINNYTDLPIRCLKVSSNSTNYRFISTSYFFRTFKDFNIQKDDIIRIIINKKSFEYPKNIMQIFIKNHYINQEHCLRVSNNTTIYEIKQMILNKDGTPITLQNLYFGMKCLENSRTLSDYNIVKENTLTILGKLLSCANGCHCFHIKNHHN